MKTLSSFLSHAVFFILAAAVLALASFLYGISQAPRGGIIDSLLVAAASGFLFFVAGLVSRCKSMALPFTALFLSVASVVGGHVVGYDDAKNFAWNYVHTTAPENFGPEWSAYDRDENFRRFVGYVTETPGDGAWAYLRLQAAIGASESRMGRGGIQSWTVSGAFVWLAWLGHILVFLIAYGAAAGANAPDSVEQAWRSRADRKTPNS